MTDTLTQSDTVQRVIAAIRQGYQDAEWRNFNLTEGDTRSLLITPVLKALGYEARYRMVEMTVGRSRPDECLYVKPVTSVQMPVAVFVEAKPLGTDFDSSPLGGRSDTPNRQIERYLLQHPASNLHTIGVLTDGLRWRIYARASDTDNRLVTDLNLRRIGHMHSRLLESMLDESVQDVHELVNILSRETLLESGIARARPIRVNPADIFFESIMVDYNPDKVLASFLGDSSPTVFRDIVEIADLQGKTKDIHDRDWYVYRYTYGPVQRCSDATSDQGSFASPPRIPIAAIHFTKGNLARSEVATSVRTFAGISPSNAAVLIAYARPLGGKDTDLRARLAVSVNGQVSMTPEFDLEMPLPSARKATAAILELVRNAPEDGIEAADLAEPLAIHDLQQRFYREVAAWVERHQLGRPRPYRQAVLQHLIRVIFAWILKETIQLPTAPFDEAFVRDALGDLDRYHEDVLEFMFHERLNVEEGNRKRHEIEEMDEALYEVPYLNGSLFMRNSEWDGLLSLSGNDYWSSDQESPGIFTILARYNWTLDENRPGEHEQTLDPELLSNLFERLIAPTDVGPEELKSMPGGTYYTPPDVADEMVKDALSAVTRRYANDLSEDDLRDLFDSKTTYFPPLPLDDANRLLERIRSLDVFDPAVGSGAFLFSALIALKAAIGNLGGYASSEAIIGRQLFGQDIQPLAVQITKLRLFIAIQAERYANTEVDPDFMGVLTVEHMPLPNLEARVVCADTLATTPDAAWSPFGPNQLDGADAEIRSILAELAEVRSRWYDAHAEDAKMRVLTEDSAVRDALRLALRDKGELASSSLLALADAEMLTSRPVATSVDSRLLFYSDEREGFDVVVGNPPYERLFASLSADKRRSKVGKLKDEMGYKTTNVDNLYSLFCEVGLALASDNGVVTMVMPHSVAFGDRQRGLRRLFESRCARVDVRHYDNRPDTVFSSSPMVRSPENRQRATILTAIVGSSGELRLRTTGLMRWSAFEREECLASRSYYTEVRSPRENGNGHHSNQWARIPTEVIAGMVAAIDEQELDLLGTENGSNPCLAIPRSAYQYLSVLPVGAIEDRRETALRVNDSFDFRLAMAAMNSHIGFAWWLIYGDGLDVKQSDFQGFGIPDEWVANPDEVVGLGQELIDAIPDCSVENRFQGKTFRNVDFHSGRPDLIERIDRRYITALGLPEEPLLSQLRVMRSNSSWVLASEGVGEDATID